MSIAEVVRTAADRYGPATAIQDSCQSRTFTELSDRAHALAAGLHGLGIAAGSRVAVLLGNSAAAVEVDLALAIGGFVGYRSIHVGRTDWERVVHDAHGRADRRTRDRRRGRVRRPDNYTDRDHRRRDVVDRASLDEVAAGDAARAPIPHP
ncbi:AMP-binding protein [Rhodococcus hoagii]|nr:AMP-binding protein [Prescottella equi]